MATPSIATQKARRPRRSVLHESRREREFYRYYEPIRALTTYGPAVCDLFDEQAVKAHQPFSSPDPALTAFCQLVALRMECRRAMLFFFDSSNAYVLAEATRTLSLKDDSVFDDDDKLWLGHSVIPRGFSICEETVCKVPSTADEEGGTNLAHIINDIEQDRQFCDRPYVTDGPKAKFYAGVPITTPRGINIGALCCLDEKKRDGVSAKSITFMHDIAATVMKHLEGVRARVEHERGTRMVSGLSAFVEGVSILRDGSEDHDDSEGEDRKDGETKPQRAATNAETQSPKAAEVATSPPDKLSRTPSGATNTNSVESEITSTLPDVSSPGASWTRSTIARREAEDLRQQLVASNIRSTFQRASRLLREATEVDGAVFLDTTVNRFGGLVDGTRTSSEQSESGTEVTETEGDEKPKHVESKDSASKGCATLASSQSPQDHLEAQRNGQTLNIPEKLLRSLLRRYGRGKIWNFDENGYASSDDYPTDDGISPMDENGPRSVSQRNASERLAERPRRKKVRLSDGQKIQAHFPGVRSLAFVGQWDHNRARWFSGCVVYSYSPLRLLSAESEGNYISAFCDVLMAEVYRLEAQNSDKAKTDFISSISHELRTPLHGILGSVECLNEGDLDPSTADLTSQIHQCGVTLLDIVDHLLEFAKINHYAKAGSALSADGSPRNRDSGSETERGQMGVEMSVDADVALDEVTEDVVDTAVYSYCCGQDKERILDRRVQVILDIEKTGAMDWNCRIPVGAWKRTLINLVSNALKHTNQGYIHVQLKRTLVLGKRRRFKVVLSVTDTGRGMAKAFVENHLFKAFSQEDSLVEGTGLGMSLVAKIVTALGGNVEVQSEQGVGTAVTVTIPVDTRRHSVTEPSSNPAHAPPAAGKALLVDLVSFDSRKEDGLLANPASLKAAHDLTFKSVEQGCLDCGHRPVQTHGAYEPSADVFIVLEADLSTHVEKQRASDSVSTPMSKPTIVLCNTVQSARQYRSLGSKVRPGHYEFVPQPCGPRRLEKALRDCFQAVEDVDAHTVAGADAVPRSSETHVHFNDAIKGADRPQIPVRPRLSPPSHTDGAAPTQPNIDPTAPPRSQAQNGDIGKLLHMQPARSSYFPTTPSTQPESDEGPGRSPITMLPQTPLSPGTQQRIVPANTPGKLNLLLVDDNHINLQLLVHYAKKQGHNRITARDGQEAVDAYQAACAPQLPPEERGDYANGTDATTSSKPDAILLDINMPKLDGFQATRLIRAFEKQYALAPAYILALTGLGSAQAQQEAFSSGVDLFLTKPVSLKELTKLLAKVKRKSVAMSR